MFGSVRAVFIAEGFSLFIGCKTFYPFIAEGFYE